VGCHTEGWVGGSGGVTGAVGGGVIERESGRGVRVSQRGGGGEWEVT
jgi:hypothetical protein